LFLALFFHKSSTDALFLPFLPLFLLFFFFFYCFYGRTEVRHQISFSAVGSWRKYAKHLQPLANEFLKYVPDLKSRGVLVYPKSINWNCDPEWDYVKAVDADGDDDEGSAVLGGRGEGKGKKRKAMMSLLGEGSDDVEENESEDKSEIEGEQEGDTDEDEEEEETEEEAEIRLKRARRRRRRRNGGRRRRRGGRRKSKSENTDDDVESDDNAVQDPVKDRKLKNKKRASSARTVDKVRTSWSVSEREALVKRLEDRVDALMKRYSEPPVRNKGKNGKIKQGPGVNAYVEALKGKGLPPSSVSMAVFSITSRWEHNSVNSNVDYIMGLGHIFVHYQEMTIGASVFKDILDIYREEGLLLPCSDRECGNDHPWNLDRVPQDGILAPVGRCFIGMDSNSRRRQLNY
jgi:hypothetical protein